MPPPLPDRYRLEVRLGRDQDIEEWLATDLNLDRPVLIRMLGPDASPKRREEFLSTVRAAAAVIHPHLEPIY
ncbi:MAG: serine/threonine protein kinase, partial [Acidimicrobiia bacterium]